mgnify:FL=1
MNQFERNEIGLIVHDEALLWKITDFCICIENSAMKVIFLFLFIILLTPAKAQDSLYVHIQLLDKKTGDVVPNVNVTVLNGSDRMRILTSTQKGTIGFYAQKGGFVKTSYSHPIYQSSGKDISIPSSGDTLRQEVLLTAEKFTNLGDVVIKPVGTPYTVYGSQRLSVADFEIQKDGTFILLAYPKRLTKGSELLVYNGQDVINSFQVPGIAKELTRDFRGNAHIVCEENVFGVHVDEGRVEIANLPKEYFAKYVMPIVDTNQSNVYFSNFNPDYPAFDYFSFDQLDSAYSKIVSIEDKLMMELYRAEYKWADVRIKLWAKQKELETGVDAEIWVGANYFTRSIYYKELYAPMFHRNDTLFVFDYYKDKLLKFDHLGNALDSVAIFHHYQPKSTGWKKDLMQDPVTGQIYARFEKSGLTYIGLIDTNTGEIKERIQLEFQWVDKVAVHDNFVYYVYRPLESIQKRYLYKEQLPYKF